MPVIKSAIKRMRQTERRTAHNARLKRRVKTAIKEYNQLISAGDIKAATTKLPTVSSLIDRAAKRNIYHRRRAARMKSRSAKLLTVAPTTKTKPGGSAADAKKSRAPKTAAKKK